MINRVNADKNLNAIRQVIENYVQGADHQNADQLDDAFHDHFRVVVMTGEGVRNLDKQTYLDFIRQEKIGGVDRSLNIEWITSKNTTARAEITLKSDTAIFHDDLSFIKEGADWRIVNNVTQVAPL